MTDAQMRGAVAGRGVAKLASGPKAVIISEAPCRPWLNSAGTVHWVVAGLSTTRWGRRSHAGAMVDDRYSMTFGEPTARSSTPGSR